MSSNNNKSSTSSKDTKHTKKTSTTQSTSSYYQSASHSSSSQTPPTQQYFSRLPLNFPGGRGGALVVHNAPIPSIPGIQLSNSQIAAMQWSNSQFVLPSQVHSANQDNQANQVDQEQKKDSGVRLTLAIEDQRQDPRFQQAGELAAKTQEYVPGPMVYPTDGADPFQAGGNSLRAQVELTRANRKGWMIVWSAQSSGQASLSQQQGQMVQVMQKALEARLLQIQQSSHSSRDQQQTMAQIQAQFLQIQQSLHSSRDQQQTMAQIQAQFQGLGWQLQAPVMPGQIQQVGQRELVKRMVTEREVTVTKKMTSSSKTSSSTSSGKKDEKDKGKKK